LGRNAATVCCGSRKSAVIGNDGTKTTRAATEDDAASRLQQPRNREACGSARHASLLLAVAGFARKFALDQFFTRKGSCDESDLAVPHRGGAVHSFCGGAYLRVSEFPATFTEGVAVFDAMNKVSFQEKGATHSYGRFYRGFGLSCSVSMIFSAFLAWHLGSLAGKLPQAIGALGWIFFAVQLAGVWLSWKYFGPPPVVFSATVAICLGWAAWLVSGL